MSELTERLDAIQIRAADCLTYNFGLRNADMLAHSDVPFLLDLARKQQAVLDAVGRLADGWEARGEYDMQFSKTLPDEDIAIAILTDGAQKVENARKIRNALEAKP